MADLTSEDVLFVGIGDSTISWYRCGMPALELGCDFVGVSGPPSDLKLWSALKRGGPGLPDWSKYKIVVLQEPHGIAWHNKIRALRRVGTIVIYEIDDYIQGVRKLKNHPASRRYKKKLVEEHELCMRACDGMIVTTEFLANRYRKFNPNVYVCKNCIEGRRYKIHNIPERSTVNIGWAGGHGHEDSVKPWLPVIDRILDEYDYVRFISVGLPHANHLRNRGQSFAIPSVAIENFPGAICNFDIAIAPAARNDYFKAKSDLRFVETGALKIPLVADPFVYDSIEDEKTGFCVKDEEDLQDILLSLIGDRGWREEIGNNAFEYVMANRTIEVGAQQWENVFTGLSEGVFDERQPSLARNTT